MNDPNEILRAIEELSSQNHKECWAILGVLLVGLALCIVTSYLAAIKLKEK